MICCTVIDTNVLVSALLSNKEDSATVQVINKILGGEIIPVYSNSIVSEYREVLNRKKLDFHRILYPTLFRLLNSMVSSPNLRRPESHSRI